MIPDFSASFILASLCMGIVANIICFVQYIRLCKKQYSLREREKELDKVELWLDKRLLDIEKREERINIL